MAARWAVWRELYEVGGFGLNPIARSWGCDHTSIANARDSGWTPIPKG